MSSDSLALLPPCKLGRPGLVLCPLVLWSGILWLPESEHVACPPRFHSPGLSAGEAEGMMYLYEGAHDTGRKQE